MWWLAPRQRAQAPVVQDCFTPPSSQYHSAGVGAPPQAQSQGFPWVGVLIGLGITAAALTGVYLYMRRPGWYVSLFNYPVGDPDRRLKSWMGPYATRDEAVAHARTQVGTWYPKVEYLDVSPRDYYP